MAYLNPGHPYRKEGSIVQFWVMALAIHGALFAMFILFPAQVASGAITGTGWRVVGIITHLYVGIIAVEHTLTIMQNVYGFKKPRLLTAIMRVSAFSLRIQEESERGRRGTNTAIVASYLFFVFWFAATYLYMARQWPGTFDAQRVDYVDTLYLSFTAMSVGPAGLNPVSAWAKGMLMAEILVGLFFVVLVFSVVGEWIKRKPASGTNSLQ